MHLDPFEESADQHRRSANGKEVATPIVIPTNDAHKHRKGSHGDIVFLINYGHVYCSLICETF
ncbi:hypothetical protein Hanom_Chr16g01467391 [Helianthus anomalus]